MVKLSLCIATYRRFDFLNMYLPDYLNNTYIDEIIICDEDGHDFELIETYFENPKIKIYQNDTKLGPFKNKGKVISLASNDWVCLMDSDNFAPIEYFKAWIGYINVNGLDSKNIYAPIKTLPEGNFDFSFMKDKVVNIHNVKEYWNIHNFGGFINTVPSMAYYHTRHDGYYTQSCNLPGLKETIENINNMLLN